MDVHFRIFIRFPFLTIERKKNNKLLSSVKLIFYEVFIIQPWNSCVISNQEFMRFFKTYSLPSVWKQINFTWEFWAFWFDMMCVCMWIMFEVLMQPIIHKICEWHCPPELSRNIFDWKIIMEYVVDDLGPKSSPYDENLNIFYSFIHLASV